MNIPTVYDTQPVGDLTAILSVWDMEDKESGTNNLTVAGNGQKVHTITCWVPEAVFLRYRTD